MTELTRKLEIAREALDVIQNVDSAFNIPKRRYTSYADFELREIARVALKELE